MLAVDGAHAWGKAATSLGLETLKGVRHNAKIFAPTSRLQKSSLKTALKTVLHKKAQAKASCVKETQKDFVVAGGDNAAERLFGHLKTALRRVQNIGRGGGETTRTVQALAGAALVRRPGYQAILDAVPIDVHSLQVLCNSRRLMHTMHPSASGCTQLEPGAVLVENTQTRRQFCII